MLNIADNRIGNDGLAVISPALNKDCVLIIFNLSNNDLDGVLAIEHLSNYIITSKTLVELNLGNNRLGDATISKLGQIFNDNKCHLQRLGLQNCQITAKNGTVILKVFW